MKFYCQTEKDRAIVANKAAMAACVENVQRLERDLKAERNRVYQIRDTAREIEGTPVEPIREGVR